MRDAEIAQSNVRAANGCIPYENRVICQQCAMDGGSSVSMAETFVQNRSTSLQIDKIRSLIRLDDGPTLLDRISRLRRSKGSQVAGIPQERSCMQVSAVQVSKLKPRDSTDPRESRFELTAIVDSSLGNNLDPISSSWRSTAKPICGIFVPDATEPRISCILRVGRLAKELQVLQSVSANRTTEHLEILRLLKHCRTLPLSVAATSSRSPSITFVRSSCVRPVLSSEKHVKRRIGHAF